MLTATTDTLQNRSSLSTPRDPLKHTWQSLILVRCRHSQLPIPIQDTIQQCMQSQEQCYNQYEFRWSLGRDWKDSYTAHEGYATANAVYTWRGRS